MIRLGSEVIPEDVVIRPGLRYTIVKVTNDMMTEHQRANQATPSRSVNGRSISDFGESTVGVAEPVFCAEPLNWTRLLQRSLSLAKGRNRERTKQRWFF